MRLRHRVPVLAIAAVGAILPASAVAVDAPASPPATPAATTPVVSVSAGLSLEILGIKLVLGSPPAAPPTVPGDPTLLGLSVAADVGVNAGPLQAQIDADAGATVSQNLGAAVTLDANVNVPGVVDTGVAFDATVPPLNSGTPPSGSLHIKGLDGSTTPASGAKEAAPPNQRPGGAIAGGQTLTPVQPPPVKDGTTSPPVHPSGPGVKRPTTTPQHPVHRTHPTSAAGGRLTRNLPPALSAPAAIAPLEVTDLPVSTQVIDAVTATGRTLALPLALLAALLAYLGLQRLLDRGPKLAWANGRTPPDDELLEL
jgi:hypothetical protein